MIYHDHIVTRDDNRSFKGDLCEAKRITYKMRLVQKLMKDLEFIEEDKNTIRDSPKEIYYKYTMHKVKAGALRYFFTEWAHWANLF